ncbi:BRO family protein [Oryzomonas rubra]|uniref:Bro-N domain-containing protein n=1 Tax=Oryzomonas rubra TaxID=2509454 RepID=A0A5A9X6H3_9BACT|nr:BRO family protein [Oryzomonas rubra]KAA0888772.1 hypothetical protein ET418_15440 [Oryzomonas rubra]
MENQAANNVQAVFSFDSQAIRAVTLADEAWFVAKDLAVVLGYTNPQKAISDHCKYAKLLKGNESLPLTDSPRGITVIPEGDMYRLIVRSKLPSAERFERWVMDEVLPQLRKNRAYSMPALPTDPMQLLKLTFDAMSQMNSRVDTVEASVTKMLDTVRLHQWQAYELKNIVTEKVQELHEIYGVRCPLLFPGIWNLLKRQFQVSSYTAIPTIRYDEACAFAKNITLSQMPDYVVNAAKSAGKKA